MIALLFILGCNACQDAAPASLPTSTPAPTKTPNPTPTPTTSKVLAKNLIEHADLQTGKGPVYSQAWSADGRWLVTADFDQVRVWETASYQEAGVLEGHTSFIWGLAWSPSPDNLILASASQDGSVRLWDVETYTQTARLGTGWAFCVAWSPDGSMLASAHQDGKVRLWDADTADLIQTIDAHKGWVRGVAWSPNGLLLASTGQDKRICLWDVATGQKYAEQHHNSLPVWSASWSPDGKFVASGAGEYKEPHVGATIVWQVP